ncbi:MAG: hypothetical protein FJ152_02100 [Firmicutes bacterium]|nr:hypothetical protein [Bacillota bacterium]
MFAQKCPGQDMRYWTAEDVYEEKCPQCGAMIEFFKTDIRLRCPNCKTRVANPRFDMGCAQWCSYAEQCLGSGAKGLKTKSIKLALEDELIARANCFPEVVNQVRAVFEKAEEICAKEGLDLPPIIANVLALILKKLELIDSPVEYLQTIGKKLAMPPAAFTETIDLATKLADGNQPERAEQAVLSLLEEISVRQPA